MQVQTCDKAATKLMLLPCPFSPDACMQDVYGMRAGHVWDACERCLGAELYLMNVFIRELLPLKLFVFIVFLLQVYRLW